MMLSIMLTGIFVVLIVMTLSIHAMWRRIVILELKVSEHQHMDESSNVVL